MISKVKNIYEDPKWQNLRKSLLGKWKEQPEWCCHKLREYIGNLKTCHINKLRRTLNYLIGTGFRTGKIKHECITKLRKEISDELRRRKEQRILEAIWKEK